MASFGVLGLFSAKPSHPIGDDGRMALSDHFRELRARLMRAVAALVIGVIIALFFYNQIFDVLLHPYFTAKRLLPDNIKSTPTTNGIGGALSIQLKICALVGVIGTAPYWLYQIWAFIVPGLNPRERNGTRAFVAVAGPLFLAGCALGYYVLPKGIQVLIGFNPKGTTNLVGLDDYIVFMSRMLLVFGLALEIPLFVVLLNLMGILPGRTLGKYRPWIVLGTFIFAAVATPSTDPISMCLLAAPMLILFALSEVIARLVDRARGKKALAELSPDEKSSIDDY